MPRKGKKPLTRGALLSLFSKNEGKNVPNYTPNNKMLLKQWVIENNKKLTPKFDGLKCDC